MSSQVHGVLEQCTWYGVGKATFTNKVFVLFIEAFPSSGHYSGGEELQWRKMDMWKKGR